MSTYSSVLYGHTRDGWFCARFGDQAFAMAPHEDGHQLVKAWGLRGDIEDWCSADFHDTRNAPVDEQSFRELVEQWASHCRQLNDLDRRSISPGAATPWGTSVVAVAYSAGVIRHQTTSHGGFALTEYRNTAIPNLLRTADGFYEQDCAWAAVAIAFPELFTDLEKRRAEDALKRFHPHTWKAHHGTVLQAGMSPTGCLDWLEVDSTDG